MPRLNQGDELIVPNVPAVRMTIEPEHAVDERHGGAVDAAEQKAAAARAGLDPAPMIARLIGIIGSTHGVRLSARPPRNTISRIASGPRPSNRPRSFDAGFGVVDELEEIVACRGSRRSCRSTVKRRASRGRASAAAGAAAGRCGDGAGGRAGGARRGRTRSVEDVRDAPAPTARRPPRRAASTRASAVVGAKHSGVVAGLIPQVQPGR